MDSEAPTTRRQQISDETLRRMSGTYREWRIAAPVCAVVIAVALIFFGAKAIGL